MYVCMCVTECTCMCRVRDYVYSSVCVKCICGVSRAGVCPAGAQGAEAPRSGPAGKTVGSSSDISLYK